MSYSDFVTNGINYWGVLIATIVYYLLGALWYSPLLFGHAWAKHEGIEVGEIKPHAGPFIGEFVLDFILAFVLAIFIAIAGINRWQDGMLLALWAWIGFVAVPHLSAVLWTGKSIKRFFINAGFPLIGMLIMGAIIGFMQH